LQCTREEKRGFAMQEERKEAFCNALGKEAYYTTGTVFQEKNRQGEPE